MRLAAAEGEGYEWASVWGSTFGCSRRGAVCASTAAAIRETRIKKPLHDV